MAEGAILEKERIKNLGKYNDNDLKPLIDYHGDDLNNTNISVGKASEMG